MPDTMIERTPRLTLAVGWLIAQTGLGVLLLFVLDLPAQSRLVGIVVAGFIFWILYGVWNFRRWAKYPLIVLLIAALLMAALDVPNLPDLASLISFVFSVLYAAANKIAYDELKTATSTNLPLI